MKNIKLTRTDRSILESYRLMLDGLSDYMGPGYEIVLHSLENMEHSAIKVINGHHTGRTEGAPITDLAVKMLSEIQDSGDVSKALVYMNKNRNGVTTKSATIPLLGENNRIIGLLCINFYMDLSFHSFINSFIKVKNPEMNTTETFINNTDDRLFEIVDEAKRQIMSNTTIPAAQKNKEIISLLQEKDIFQIKNAVERVADYLGISKNTVYMHIRNLAKENSEG